MVALELVLKCPLAGKLLPQAISIVHRLVIHAAVPNTEASLQGVLVIIEATATGNEDVQLRGLQCIMPLLTHYECHGAVLYRAYEVCFRMVASRGATVVNAAIAIIRQQVIWLFEKVIEEENEAEASTDHNVDQLALIDVQKDGQEDKIRMRSFAADAFVILQDIALLANDEKALVLPMTALNKR